MEWRNPALKEGGAGGSAWSFPEGLLSPLPSFPLPSYRPSRPPPIHAIIPPNLNQCRCHPRPVYHPRPRALQEGFLWDC